MSWNPTLTDLRNVLVELYPTEEDARQIVLTAGLDLSLIGFSTRAINNWTNILLVADNNEQVEDLIQVALEQFPRSTKLQNAVKAYHGDKPTAISSAAPPIPEAAAVDKTSLRKAMVKAFSTGELEILCSDIQTGLADDGIELQVSLGAVGGSGIEVQVLNLIEYLDRRGHMAYLVDAVRQARPGII